MISPEQRNPKKHTVAAAHIMRISCVMDLSHNCFMALKATSVMGRRTLVGRIGLRALTRRMPAISNFNLGREDGDLIDGDIPEGTQRRVNAIVYALTFWRR